LDRHADGARIYASGQPCPTHPSIDHDLTLYREWQAALT
jgi:hypothetical protein